MKKICLFTVLACLAFLFLSVCHTPVVSAALIDFRVDDPWQGANGLASFDYMGITLSASPGGSLLWQDSEDGLGIQNAPRVDIPAGYENDEIEGSELLEISFVQSTLLNAIYLADLFIEQGSNGPYFEMGQYSINGGAWVDFSADDATYNWRGNDNGEIFLVLNIPDVNSIRFRAPGVILDQNHEFAVQGVDVGAPMPEPATILLLASGAGGYFLTRMRRRKR